MWWLWVIGVINVYNAVGHGAGLTKVRVAPVIGWQGNSRCVDDISTMLKFFGSSGRPPLTDAVPLKINV